MAQVRTFRLYDMKFFLETENKYYCLSNRTRFTNNQFSLTTCFLDSLNLLSSESIAVARGPYLTYYWGGQISFDMKKNTAWFSWLIAGKHSNNSNLLELLEFLVTKAGKAGMQSCAVVLDEGQWVTGSFRQIGFSVYSKQTVWCYKGELNSDGENWQSVSVTPFDEYDLFYESQITPLIRQLGSNWNQENIYALKKDGMIQATAKATAQSGNRVYLEPIFNPGVENPAKSMLSLAKQINHTTDQEVYVMIPGFQAWANDPFNEENFNLVCRQTVFVKNLAAKVVEEKPAIQLENGYLQPVGPANFQMNKKEK